jgi:uncharacterized protein (DUF58 family)
MMAAVTSRLRQRWSDWWEARLPRQDELRLTQRNLYILPTRAGWGFAAVVSVLLLASINEQINLGYALAFLLGGAGLAALYQTHGNLQGIRLTLGSPPSVHAGQIAQIPVTLTNQHRRLWRCALAVSAALPEPGRPDASRQFADLPPGQDASLTIDIPTHLRGRQPLPRLVIETRYPLGLFRAWSYWRPRSQVLVWPALDPHAPPLPDRASTDPAHPTAHPSRQGQDLPEGLRDYRRGDPVRWIAWKKSSLTLATGAGLITREPASSRAPDRWLDLETSPGLAGLGTEQRLSRLASWLLAAEQEAAATGQAYGLRLPGQTVACGMGASHLRHCLDMLATWQGGAHRGAPERSP